MKKESNFELQILDAEGLDWALNRIAHEIIERNRGTSDLVLIGIKSRGDILAERLKKKIEHITKSKIKCGAIDITFYRDDVNLQPYKNIAGQTKLPFDISNKKVVLVDDVLYTGRSVRAAIDELVDFGRPKILQLAVLIDRGHRELPIQADYAGKVLNTARDEKVLLHLKEIDGKDSVVIKAPNES